MSEMRQRTKVEAADSGNEDKYKKKPRISLESFDLYQKPALEEVVQTVRPSRPSYAFPLSCALSPRAPRSRSRSLAARRSR